MDTLEQIQQQRVELAQQMLQITSACPGTINEQYLPARKHGKPTGEKVGPYLVLTAKKHGRTVSKRLKGEQMLQQTQLAIDNHHKLRRLMKEFEELTQKMGELTPQPSVSEEALKKGLKSR